MNIEHNTFAESYQDMLIQLLHFPDYVSKPRGLTIYENLNVSIKINNPYNNLFTNEARSIPLRYLSGELVWYFSGSNNLEFIKKYSSFWVPLANNDGSINSAYGNLLFIQKNEHGLTQWEWAKNSLLNDKDSRQAVMHFNKPIHQHIGVSDFVCTMHIQFFIRKNKLIMISAMRSQDVVLGASFDNPFFMLLMQCMRLELLNKYPDLELGYYCHHVGSLHIYENKLDIARKMLCNDFISGKAPFIVENPILNKNIFNISNGNKYSGDDKFFEWLSLNLNGE